jgi:hypothetical protein
MSITEFRVICKVGPNLCDWFEQSDAKPQAPTVLFLVPNSGPQDLKCGQNWALSYYEKQITKERKQYDMNITAFRNVTQ